MITSAGFSFFSVILSCGNLSLRSSGELKEELPYTMGTASEMGLKLIDGFGRHCAGGACEVTLGIRRIVWQGSV